MAGLTLFTHTPGPSRLHALDVRIKSLLACLLSLALARSSFSGCLLLAAVLVTAARHAGLPLAGSLKRLGWFYLLLFFVVAGRAFSIPGEPIMAFGILSISGQGMASGILAAGKFFLVMLLGLVFTACTPLSELKKAVYYFLRPVPLIPHARVAVIMGLSLAFIPMIFQKADQVSDARKARGADGVKRPVRQAVGFGSALLRACFSKADQVALAMEARAYSDNRTPPVFRTSGREGAALVLGVTLAILVASI